MEEKKKFWIMKRWETLGVHELLGRECKDRDGKRMIVVEGSDIPEELNGIYWGRSNHYFHGDDFACSEEEAHSNFEERKAKKIKSLKKSIHAVEAMEYPGGKKKRQKKVAKDHG